MNLSSNWLKTIFFLLLAAALAACGGGVDETEVAVAVSLTQTAVAQSEPVVIETAVAPPPAVEDSPTETTNAATPIDPTETPAEAPAEPTVEETNAATTAVMQGVSFNYDEALAGGLATQELLPRLPLGEGPGHGSGYPETIRFTFPGGGAIETFPEGGRIEIFSIDEYLGLFPLEYEIVDALKQTIAQQEIDPDNPLPYLPSPAAAQMYTAHPEYVDFQNGSGIRYLTQYSQAPVPIAPYYVFQGITDDGKFYVSAIMPISSDFLPTTTFEEFAGVMERENGLQSYNEETLALIDGLSDNQFSPALTTWDSMIASLTAVPTDFPSPGAPASNIPDCVNDAAFITDVAIPDNTEIDHDSTFEKVWKVKNTGTCTWTAAYSARYVDGDVELAAQTIALNPQEVPPGAEAEVTVAFTAPHPAGNYISWWRMNSPAQRSFGDRFYTLIEVPLTETNQPITEVPGYGVIRGALAFPSESIPAMDIYFMDVDDNQKVFYLRTEDGWSDYENELPAGNYYVFARVTDDTSGFGGGYTAAVPCGLTAACTDHSLLVATIYAGELTEGVDVTDWYAPVGAFPFP